MDPALSGRGPGRAGFPRTRGDGPRPQPPIGSMPGVSPHTRGWTHGRPVMVGAHPGFPAHAGMDPGPGSRQPPGRRFPRTRGDGPVEGAGRRDPPRVSPHTRGWTRSGRAGRSARLGFPAHAGMDPRHRARSPTDAWFPRTRGDGPRPRLFRRGRTVVSPHTRGWTRHGLSSTVSVGGFPAHAGMDPRTRTASSTAPGFPRTRGDGPG